MVIIQRINLGLYSLFGELHATGNWRRLAEELWPFVDGPPVDADGPTTSRRGARLTPTLASLLPLADEDRAS